jgi:hypothetical protein
VRRGFRGYPVATVAYYGPDDQRASKVVVGITNGEGQEVAELRRWFSETGDLRFDPVINRQMVEFIEAHAVQTVAGVERIIGCPHEEGVDYAQGSVCPACPYWAHRDRWTGEAIH